MVEQLLNKLLNELLRVSQMREFEDVGVSDQIMPALSGQELSRQELGVLLSVFAEDTPNASVVMSALSQESGCRPLAGTLHPR